MTSSPSSDVREDGSFHSPEGSVPSRTIGNAQRVNLLSQLLRDGVDVKKLYEDWLAATGDDWISRKKDFVELLFFSIGWLSFTYNDFQSRIVQAFITRERAVGRVPALEASYLNNFDDLLKCIFDGYNWLNSGALQFLSSIGEAVQQLMKGSYDSTRVIAVRTGMKILTVIKISRDTLRGNSSSEDSLDSVAFNHSGSGLDSSALMNQSAAMSKIKKIRDSMIDQFFPRAIRDVCQEIRQIVYCGMLEWSNMNPVVLLESFWHKFLKFGLHDDSKLFVISTLKNLFQEQIDTTKQQELFKKIKKSVIRHLADFGESSFIAIEILCSAARYLDVANMLDKGDLETVFLHVYHPDKVIAVTAATFIFDLKITHVKQPPLFLIDLAIFNSESADVGKVSSEELLVDSFCHIMARFVKWEHWMAVFVSCPTELLIGCAKLFINYVKKVTTNYCPPGRSKAVNRFSKKDVKSACDGFTMFLSTQYTSLLNADRIRMNPEAWSLIVRSMIFFNKKISSHVALEILSFLSTIIRSNATTGMIASCWSAMYHLKMTLTFDITAKMQLISLWESLRSYTIKDFMDFVTVPSCQPDIEVIEHRMLGLIKCGAFSDEAWGSCCDKLQSLIDGKTNSAAISVVLKVLYNVVFHQYKLVDALAQNDDEEVEEGNSNSSSLSDDGDPSRNLYMLLDRFSKLQNYAIVLIDKQFDLHVRVEAFLVLSSAIECFGKHMAKHPTLCLVSGVVDDKVESLLLDFACEAMKWNPDEKLVKLEVCCDVLKRISLHFGSHYIDITNIADLLVLISRQRSPGAHIDRHGVEVMSALKKFMGNFPDSGKRVAMAIFKGACGVMKGSSADSLESTIGLATKTVEYWRIFEDFEKVVRCPIVSGTLRMMFEYLVARAGREEYKLVGESFMCQSRSKAGTSLVRFSAPDDRTDSMVRTPAQDSDVNYSAFRRRAGIGHSTFLQYAASTPSKTSA